MGFAKKAVVAGGLAMLAWLLWRLDAAETAALALQVRWLFLLILLQELGAHAFNALGWRLAFRPEHAASFRFLDLVRFRVMGDGVNYLTPSASIAGEFARASLLNECEPMPVRVNGVVAAKFSQAYAQLMFVSVGMGWIVGPAVPALSGYAAAARAAAAVGAAAGAALWLSARGRGGAPAAHSPRDGWKGWVSRLPVELMALVADHPVRCLASTAAFAAGFAWNMGEAWLISRALGVPVGPGTALRIEVLSCMVDALMFMVPAKAGTQEAGKTLIFSLLGLPPRAGLAFGLVRHARELCWASLGLASFAAHERARKAAGAAVGAAAPATLPS